MPAPGPFLAPHVLLKWGGTLPGNEIWSCQLRMGRTGAGPWPDLVNTTNPVSIGWWQAIQAYHTSANSRIHSAALLSYVKINQIGVDGRYSLLNTNTQNLGGVGGGATAAPQYPNQVSLAVTLKTAVARGHGHNTRFFLPIPNPLVQSDGRISVADQTQIRNAVVNFVAALNAVSPLYVASVFSRVAGAPTQRPITGYAIGRVLDTQQRRRAALLESY